MGRRRISSAAQCQRQRWGIGWCGGGVCLVLSMIGTHFASKSALHFKKMCIVQRSIYVSSLLMKNNKLR